MIPHQRFVQIRLHAETVFIAPAQIVLGRSVVLHGGFFIPVSGFPRVFGGPASVAIAPGQVILGAGVSLFRGLLVPVYGLFPVFPAGAVGINPAEVELGYRMALFRRFLYHPMAWCSSFPLPSR